MKVHDSVEVPEPVTLPGVRVHAIVSLLVKVTTAENPFSPVTVIVDVAATLGLKLTVVGLAVIWKSWTVKVTVAE